AEGNQGSPRARRGCCAARWLRDAGLLERQQTHRGWRDHQRPPRDRHRRHQHRLRQLDARHRGGSAADLCRGQPARARRRPHPELRLHRGRQRQPPAGHRGHLRGQLLGGRRELRRQAHRDGLGGPAQRQPRHQLHRGCRRRHALRQRHRHLRLDRRKHDPEPHDVPRHAHPDRHAGARL
ncbi:MAG: Chaperone protein DnaJ, partial [uncultured Nocardioidaceae bacterium]